MNLSKFLMLGMLCFLTSTALLSQLSPCMENCLEGPAAADIDERLADASAALVADPSTYNRYAVAFIVLNGELANLECRVRCEEVIMDAITCNNFYYQLYNRYVKTWEFSRYYDSLLALLNHFFDIMGCDVDSPG